MTQEPQDQPVFSVQKIYTKDISFENPNAPQSFNASENPPRIELNLGVQNRKLGEEQWEVALKISALARDSESNNVLFEVEVEQAGVFLIKGITEDRMPALLGVDCPSIVFPYTRQVVSQLTEDGGYMPLLLDPFNFAAAYQSNLEQQQTTH